MQFHGEFTTEWGDEPRRNKLIFIGKNLNREALIKGFAGCANTLQHILEADVASTQLRFAQGSEVS